jgi:uncharacterized protein (UPF0276 family)
MTVALGARWDDQVQNERILEAFRRGLIDYIEVNYPNGIDADPHRLGIPILAHTSSNPLCSALGVDLNIAQRVKDGADRADSSWIGEHLSWLNIERTGSLGYQINPLFTPEFVEIAVLNIGRLRDYYRRPIALELGPIYVEATGCESEMHFLGGVAERADTGIILDIAHWQIANRNLERPADFGLAAIDRARIVELHVAGMRQGTDRRTWHDAHEIPPDEFVMDMTARLARELPSLKAVTFEHHPTAPVEDFYRCLAALRRHLGQGCNA